MAILTRRPKSGFVLYPKYFEKRTVDGTARFRTKCDMLIGPCACGAVHQESDNWVQNALQDYNCIIEPLILHSELSVVKIPRYWQKPRNHRHCTILVGLCLCGSTHTANDQWVQSLLASHNTIIENCVQETLSESDDFIDVPSSSPFNCDCDSCQQHQREGQRVDRRDI